MWVPVDGEILAPVGDAAEPFIDVQDIAEVAAEILARRSHVGETVTLSGPAALTFDQAASVLSTHPGTTVRYVAEDRDAHVARLRAAGTPDTYITWRMAMLDGIREQADAYLSFGVDDVPGRPATGFATSGVAAACAIASALAGARRPCPAALALDNVARSPKCGTRRLRSPSVRRKAYKPGHRGSTAARTSSCAASAAIHARRDRAVAGDQQGRGRPTRQVGCGRVERGDKPMRRADAVLGQPRVAASAADRRPR